MANELPITATGEKKLKDELNQLIKVDREEIKQKISEARELGDLKENAEYHSAKEKQALLEGRISQLQGILAASQVIDPTSIRSDKIVFGATVTLVDVEKGTLSCQLYQRSGDMFLGVPYNIASYSFLTYIFAHLTGYKPGKLIHIIGDAHIYEEHIEAVHTQLTRTPKMKPRMIISDDLVDIDDVRVEHFTLKEYESHETIKAPMIA